MAYSKSNAEQVIAGNKRVVTFDLTCDAASGAVDTGLSVVTAYSFSPVSAATASPLVKRNLNSGATALNGSLFVKNATAGDVFQVVCWGK